MRKNRACWLLLGGLVAAAGARACLFEMPWQLLDNRRETLVAAPSNSFAWEVSHWVPASRWVRAPVPAYRPALEAVRAAAETVGLGPVQQAELVAMRASRTGAAALAVAGDLPPAIRYYTAGAVAFAGDDLSGAVVLFNRVAGLPSGQAAPRLIWAQYMLGRIAAKQGDTAAADVAFAAVRTAAERGVPDPLGLAIASLGETARLRLDAGDVAGAVRLYAEQAADGSVEGVESLKMVAEDAMAVPDRLPDLVTDPTTQRLLVLYALGLTGDYLHAVHASGLSPEEIPFSGFYPVDNDELAPLVTLLQMVQTSPVAVAEVDRLAALAYRLGDYTAAEVLAGRSRSPLAFWVLAKIALQRYDIGPAAKLFAEALRASADAPAAASLEPSSIGLLRGEVAVITLARGDFVQAAGVLWPVAGVYWGDFAYLAERVLTTDELMAFVDGHAPAAEHPADPDRFNAVNAVRGLLARRLMRDGRYQAALAYFAGLKGDLQTGAVALATASERSRDAFWAVDRAKAAWDAAVVLRTRGMELTGTETSPDQVALDGAFATGYGQDRRPDGAASEALPIVQDESVRYDESRPRPDLRFHYRYLAAEQAVMAADLLPPRSQAFAAMLCQASGWMMSTHADEKAQAPYRRYVSAGAVVPFARHFGHDCPEPDFAAVSATRWKLLAIDGRDALHRRKWTAVIAGLLLLAVAGGAGVWVRKARG